MTGTLLIRGNFSVDMFIFFLFKKILYCRNITYVPFPPHCPLPDHPHLPVQAFTHFLLLRCLLAGTHMHVLMTEKSDILDCISICQVLNIKIVLLLNLAKCPQLIRDNIQHWKGFSEVALWYLVGKNKNWYVI